MIEFLLGVVLLFCLFGFVTETLPHWKAKLAEKAEERARKCAGGHDWGRPFNAMDNPQWPKRNCRRCGKQEQMDRCPGCGKCIDRSTGRPAKEVDDSQHPDDPS